MENKNTITALVVDEQEAPIPGKQMLPTLQSLRTRVVEIKKEALSESLNGLISDMTEILADLTVSPENIKLEEVNVEVQFTADGGVRWIASAGAGLSHSMRLTFKIRSRNATESNNSEQH